MLKGNKSQNFSTINTNDFEEYFCGLLNPNDVFYEADDDIRHFLFNYSDERLGQIFGIIDADISMEEMEKAISQLKNGKSGGEDLLLNELFIHGNSAMIKCACKIFNVIFQSGIFPEPWSEEILVPLIKKGNINITDNYRGITLLSVLGKLFTRIMNNRLVTWAEEYRIYVEAQGGFRPGRGTVDNIFVLNGIVNSYLSSGKALYTALIDFSKAFDYVVRDNLWYKLIQVGVSGKMLCMIRAIYENVKTKVFFQGNKSEEFEYSLGVRQGYCLSPFLFAMYINDLEQILIDNHCGIDFGQYKMTLLLYADDVILLSDSSTGLQNALDVMQNHSNRWKLKINVTKSKILVFKKGRRRANERWIYGNAEIQQTNSIPYLGIVFTRGGTMTTAQKTLSEQTLKATFDLQKKISNFDCIKPPEVKDLFYKMVVPILNYPSEVWGFHSGADVERVHLKFLKNLLGVKRSTQNDFIYWEYGTTPLSETRKIQILKYWTKIVCEKKSHMVTNCYNVMYNHSLVTENCTNWASRVRDLLFSLVSVNAGFNNVSEIWKHL